MTTPAVVGDDREVGGALHERSEPALARPQRLLGDPPLVDLTLERGVGLFHVAAAAAQHDGDPHDAEPEHERHQGGERELAVLVGLQRRRRHGVEVLLLRAAQAVDPLLGPRDQLHRLAAQDVVASAARDEPVPGERPELGPDVLQLADLRAVRLERDDRDHDLPRRDGAVEPDVVGVAVGAEMGDRLLQDQDLAVGVGQVRRPRLRLLDLLAHPAEQERVQHDQADGGEQHDDDDGDEHARARPALPPTRAGRHRTSIVSMFQIHMSGLKRSARPSANTMRVGPPSSIGSTVPSPVRVARKIDWSRTSARVRSTW